MTVWIVPTESLADQNPYELWDINYQEIAQCILENDLDKRPWDYGDNPVQACDKKYDRLYHARRVSYLVVNPCNIPIELDVGIPGICYPEFIIQDGNHRLASFIFRKEKYITITYSGDVNFFKELFPIRKILKKGKQK